MMRWCGFGDWERSELETVLETGIKSRVFRLTNIYKQRHGSCVYVPVCECVLACVCANTSFEKEDDSVQIS